MNYDIEEQVDRLETLLGQFIVQTNMGFKKVNRGLTRLENEMREFKDEMRAFKDEMKKSQELRDVETRRMNQRWGDVVNKWGKLVEDWVAPNFETIIKQKFNLEIIELFVRHKRKLAPGQVKEFDLIAVTEEFVFLNSTKSTLISNHVDELIDEIKIFWKLYPEFHNLKLIGVLSGIYTDNSVLNYAVKKGFLVIGVGLELMELKNDPKFEPKIWTYSAKN